MSVLLRSPVLCVRIANTGAEIKSIKEHATGLEYIWQSDPTHWTGAAPVLFPIIGGLKNGQYTYEGKSYSMPGHGIVRKTDWDLISSDPAEAVFQTTSSEATKKLYPFDFVLNARFSLQDNRLDVAYEVTNSGDDMMYFSIGSHPAFNVPFAGGHWENYYLHFSESESIERHFFADGMTLNETAPIFDNSRQIFLTPPIFDRLAIILKGPASKEVSLRNSRNSKQVKLVTDGMPYLGLWAPAGAPFVCVEPWHGVPDNVDTDGDFTRKEGIMSLAAKGTYHTKYGIEII
ncbi:MAG: aldose 1-epimerase family protein [Planctomycetes bacterium]|nr:aldose 1-epimerase family protein [Planctomycetota bacterium]